MYPWKMLSNPCASAQSATAQGRKRISTEVDIEQALQFRPSPSPAVEFPAASGPAL